MGELLQPRRGRGAASNPPNRFLAQRLEVDDSTLDQWSDGGDEDSGGDGPLATGRIATEYFDDQSQTVVSENDSPDIPFRFSVNPYRGCAHGCPFCYARPYHEYLGLSAGLDFESQVFVKRDVVAKLRSWLERRQWKPEPICVSGVTDCYQPVERHYRLTRGILETALAYRQPLTLITRNALIERDLDVLSELARLRLIHVAISLTTLDAWLSSRLEPRATVPAARLRAIARLTEAGVPVRVMAAPVIPGLTDVELPAILSAARDAGAQAAGYTLLRLPGAVQQIFQEWLQVHVPLRAAAVIGRIRQTREGELTKAEFGERMTGTGPFAEMIRQQFDVYTRRLGLAHQLVELDCGSFRIPDRPRQQMLF